MNQIELGMLDTIARHAHNVVLDAVVPWISMLGNSGWIWIVLAVALVCFRAYRKTGMTLVVALLLELTLVDFSLKPLIGRIRPFVLNPAITLLSAQPVSGSFPSGHSSTAFASAFVIFHFDRKWGVAAYVLAALIALSRLYLYAHYPSDVLGGAAIGTLIGMGAVWIAGQVEKTWQARRTTSQKVESHE
jgi:undecaprenyl-diphosphatase